MRATILLLIGSSFFVSSAGAGSLDIQVGELRTLCAGSSPPKLGGLSPEAAAAFCAGYVNGVADAFYAYNKVGRDADMAHVFWPACFEGHAQRIYEYGMDDAALILNRHGDTNPEQVNLPAAPVLIGSLGAMGTCP